MAGKSNKMFPLCKHEFVIRDVTVKRWFTTVVAPVSICKHCGMTAEDIANLSKLKKFVQVGDVIVGEYYE